MSRRSPRPAQDVTSAAAQPSDRRRALPSVDEVVRALAAEGHEEYTHVQAVRAAREALAEARHALKQPDSLDAGGAADAGAIISRARELLAEQRRPTLRPVINATGVIISTNLGRAPLAAAAIETMAAVAAGYSNLEYELRLGERGSRQAPVRNLLCALTGAEDALAVNNNAAAVMLVLAALASGKEVIVSRGELVEIGGGFRIPDVLRQSGARLIEVGTTNRTRLRDFEQALTDETAALLAVHPSNFRIVGFTEAPPLAGLAALAHDHGLPLIHDVGSGCLLATERWGLAHEPTPQESIAAGADVVCFSGDKLLGGPQAGLIAGRAALLEQIARHPLMRAVRSDKLTLAALEATLRLYRDEVAEREIPVWRMIAMPQQHIRQRAERWVAHLASAELAASAVADFSTIGGGSLPGETLPTTVCAIELPGTAADLAAERLRLGSPPVVARVSRGRLLLDPRTVHPDADDALLHALEEAIRG